MHLTNDKKVVVSANPLTSSNIESTETNLNQTKQKENTIEPVTAPKQKKREEQKSNAPIETTSVYVNKTNTLFSIFKIFHEKNVTPLTYFNSHKKTCATYFFVYINKFANKFVKKKVTP